MFTDLHTCCPWGQWPPHGLEGTQVSINEICLFVWVVCFLFMSIAKTNTEWHSNHSPLGSYICRTSDKKHNCYIYGFFIDFLSETILSVSEVNYHSVMTASIVGSWVCLAPDANRLLDLVESGKLAGHSDTSWFSVLGRQKQTHLCECEAHMVYRVIPG